MDEESLVKKRKKRKERKSVFCVTKFSVTYNGNSNTSGAAPTDATQYKMFSNVAIANNTGSLLKTGFTFSGWNTNTDGSGKDYKAGATIIIGAYNLALYAKWVL